MTLSSMPYCSFLPSFFFATLSTFNAADLCAETWNDDPSLLPAPLLLQHLISLSLALSLPCSFRCLGTFYGPAPAVSCFALERANKLGIHRLPGQLIYIKPSFLAAHQPKDNCNSSRPAPRRWATTARRRQQSFD